MRFFSIGFCLALVIHLPVFSQSTLVKLLDENKPEDFVRKPPLQNSFSDYLFKLSFTESSVTLTYDNFEAHSGNVFALHRLSDLTSNQQCADVIMRMNSEYKIEEGKSVGWTNVKGEYQKFITGNNFEKYLQLVYNYSNTYSLYKFDSYKINFEEIQSGDILVIPGFPGHVVLIADVIKRNDEIRVAIIEGFTPAVHPFLYHDDNKEIYLPVQNSVWVSGYEFKMVENLRRLK